MNQTNNMLAETVPPKILPRILKRFDLVTIYFAVVFGSYGAAQLAASGWSSIPMLLLAVITFLIPCALASYELGTLFPSEGGIYVWAHKTFGPIHGFIAGWLSWIPIFLLIPLNATVISSLLQYVFGQSWSLTTQILVQLCFVWVLFIVASRRLRFSQNIVNTMFFVAIGTAIAALISGLLHGSVATPVTNEIFSLDISKYGFVYSAAVLWLLGVEVPFNMGAEFSDHKKTGKVMLTWGTVALVLGYLAGIVGVLLTTPLAEIDQTAGIAKAVGSISPTAGIIVAIGIVLCVFAQATTTMNAYSRLLFISGIEKRVPKKMAEVDQKNKTPWPAMLVQAIVGSIVILIFVTQTQLVVTFNLYLAALVAVWCASLFYIYFGLIRARKNYQTLYEERGSEVWIIPGGKIGLWLTFIVGVVFNVLAIYFVFAKPWTSGISTTSWQAWLGTIMVAVIAIGIIIFQIGKKKAIHSEDSVEIAK